MTRLLTAIPTIAPGALAHAGDLRQEEHLARSG